MFDRPGLILLTLCAAFGPLVGFALVKRFGLDALTALTALFIDFGTWYVVHAFVELMIADFKSLASRDEPRKAVEPRPAPDGWRPLGLKDLNTGKMVNAFQVPTVKIDHMSRKIKHHCLILLNQREQGFKIDLRETTWNPHFGGRDNWVWVRDTKLAGAYAKEAGRINSPFVVVDWRIVEEGARGMV